jgi:hypothetical protein
MTVVAFLRMLLWHTTLIHHVVRLNAVLALRIDGDTWLDIS